MLPPTQDSRHMRCGGAEIDLQIGEVRLNGHKAKLQDKPLQILLLLLARPGELVTRDEIRRSLWRDDTFVDFEHSINTAVKKLREALQDDSENPHYIETLPRHGYRLVAPVEDAVAVAKRGRGNQAVVALVQRHKTVSAIVVAAIALGLGVAAYRILQSGRSSPLRQHDWRFCIRRHVGAGPGCQARGITVRQPRSRR